MAQRFKSVYFADHPADSPQKKNVTLAFGDKDEGLYEVVKDLSSHEMRELIGHSSMMSMQRAAEDTDLSVNTYCLRVLRQKERILHEVARQLHLPGLSQDAVLPIDPIQATFRGGQSEPLHGWYPYLEGYSPQFVEHVLKTYAPQASRILDPFSGTGTTPLTVARLGKQAFYCEVNPLLQYLTEAKFIALTMDQAARTHLATFLMELSHSLGSMVESITPDAQLRMAYGQAFGASQFFDEDTFEGVLRVRALIDHIACTTPLVAKFVTVAVLASLTPASLLIRRGDVRYKTEGELERTQVALLPTIQDQMKRIAADLKQLNAIKHRGLLVCEDARRLDAIPALHVDAVVTSPPYLNGTNYFRNTKVELWFLRCLQDEKDLAAFRYKAVTAGINDVTVGKLRGNISQGLADVIAKLETNAYDRRIPQMVASYFTDMQAIFSAIKEHLNDNAVLLIDIGDSSYGGVHVQTDKLLTDLLISQGFALKHAITLRKRMSRSGFPLRQVLLVFQLQRKSTTGAVQSSPRYFTSWENSWQDFKTQLPHQRGAFAKRNWGHPLHSLCSYQGKMKPSLASHLVRTFVPADGTLLDPFAGVGTIPFEAALQGIKTWSFDISPAALQIATAKLGRVSREDCEATLDALRNFIATQHVTEDELLAAQHIRFNRPLTDYFNTQTFGEVLLARRYFRGNQPSTPSESLVFASLLHILHGNRPYALSRRSHPITPFAPTGGYEYRALLPRLRDKVGRSLTVTHPDQFVPGNVLYQDATSWWPQEVRDLDAIITSPPFFDSTRFYLANWMRLWFCGWEAADFRSQPLAYVDERQKATFDIYKPIFQQARERLKPGGVMVLHLGKSKKCDMTQELSRLAAQWFQIADIFAESVSHCESHGISDKGAVAEHKYLVLR